MDDNVDVPIGGSILSSQNEDLKTAEEVLQELADEARNDDSMSDWVAENLEGSKEVVKQKRGVR